MMLANILGRKKNPLPLMVLRRVAQSSPLFALGAWFLYRTERGERIRHAVMNKFNTALGVKPTRSATA